MSATLQGRAADFAEPGAGDSEAAAENHLRAGLSTASRRPFLRSR